MSLYFFSIHFELWDPLNTNIDYLFTKITIVFYFLVSIGRIKQSNEIKKFTKFIIPIVLLFIIQTVSGYLNQSPGHTEYFSLIFFLNIIMFLLMLIHHQKDNNAILTGLNSYVLGAIFLTLFFFLGIESDNSWHNRATVFGQNQNILAINLSVGLLIILYRLFDYNKLNNKIIILYIVSIPFIMIFMADTGSRSGIISFVLGIIVFFLLKKTRNTIGKIGRIFVGFLTIFVIALYFLNNDVVGARLNNSLNYVDLSGRDNTWRELIPLFRLNPFFGMGMTGYTKVTEEIFGYYTSAHNSFIETTIIGGFSSMLLLLIFLYLIIRKAKHDNRVNGSILSLMFLAPIFVEFTVGQAFGSKILWGLYVFIIGYRLNDKKHINWKKLN